MSVITTTWGYGNWSSRENLTYVPANQPNTVNGQLRFTSPYGMLLKQGYNAEYPDAQRRPYHIQQSGSTSYIQYDTDPAVIFKVVTE